MPSEKAEPVFPVGFDEDALAEDLEHLPAEAEKALRVFRKTTLRQGGIPRSRLIACQAEGRDGTRLAGCVKTYIPWPDGRFGAVFVAVTHPARPLGLRAVAFGIRHHPRGSSARTVYEVANSRLHPDGSQ
ncbi:MAG TPA: hypothetical protein VHA80_10620 [Solirubrobacterales bacterium]|nr:hypothetical protein [Solirubrobacterales bacterium]